MLGLVIVCVTAAVFWGTCAAVTVAGLNHAAQARAIRTVCEHLVESGWEEHDVDGCVLLFRSVPD